MRYVRFDVYPSLEGWQVARDGVVQEPFPTLLRAVRFAERRARACCELGSASHLSVLDDEGRGRKDLFFELVPSMATASKTGRPPTC